MCKKYKKRLQKNLYFPLSLHHNIHRSFAPSPSIMKMKQAHKYCIRYTRKKFGQYAHLELSPAGNTSMSNMS